MKNLQKIYLTFNDFNYNQKNTLMNELNKLIKIKNPSKKMGFNFLNKRLLISRNNWRIDSKVIINILINEVIIDKVSLSRLNNII